MSPAASVARWLLVTGSGRDGGALAVFHLHGDIGAVFRRLEMEPVEPGGARLRRFADIDRGVVARPSDETLLLMPHAGPAVVRRIGAWLSSCGLAHGAIDDLRSLYPEAASPLEARMLDALARAPSPLAIGLLLDQPRRWRDVPADPGLVARSAVLNRLVIPPTVAALGPPNIGKSTLLNALAKRAVSIVADEPGTTRDHVGVRLDLAGLVVNYIDAPGIDASAADEIQQESQEIALTAAGAADLVLLCADSGSGFLSLSKSRDTLRVGLRADNGVTHGADVNVSARTGEGLEKLVLAMRDRLVAPEALTHPGRWDFR